MATPCELSTGVAIDDRRDGSDANAPDADLLHWAKLIGAGVSVGDFCGYDALDRFLVRVAREAEPLPAASTLALREGDIGCRVVVAYEGGDRRRPIVVGRLQARPAAGGASVRLDGERLLLEGEHEVELRCGAASIVLTRAGKVLIRGTYVSSRSRGANRIKGAYVDIN